MDIKRLFEVVLLSVLLVFIHTASVDAHAGLLRSIPNDGEIVKQAPQAISLRFTETLEPDLVSIQLFDANGREIAIEQAKLQPGDASQVNARLPVLQEGSYVVKWSVVSEDGHPIDETFIFSVGKTNNLVSQPTTKQNVLSDAFFVFFRYMTQGLILLGGGLHFISWRAQKYGLPFESKELTEAKMLGWIFSFLGVVALWFLYDDSLQGMPLSNALHQGNWEVLSQAPFAVMLVVSALLLFLVAIPYMAGAWYRMIWFLLVSVQAFGGHAWGIDPSWLAIGVRVLHVITVSFWLGTLFYLVYIFTKAQVRTEESKRFFLRALGISAILTVLTGVVMVLLQTDVVLLFKQVLAWNFLLLAKIGIVCFMLALAYRQTMSWRKANSLSPVLLYVEISLGVIALLMGIWMSQINYPTEANPVQQEWNVKY